MTMRPGTMPDAGVDAAGAPPGSGLGAASGRAPGGARPPAVETGRAAVGRRGERIAARYLGDRGWRVLDRNWRPGPGLRGELDLVALEPSAGTRPAALVVVEVKTRTTLSAGPPAAAVDSAKLARLRTLAAAWAAEHSAPHGRLRLDVISVLLRPGLPAELRHHRGVGLT
ncbi:YraN family protein [Actinomyces sp. oral taxon 448]|uniref:YraN family protein n=1 Tax=Actinomyces sp. oral taxon 448 TaxID=712124 RepID=UPI00209EE873|nr:YraN family protein [Actinomyces sp. oral taxon 448]